MKKFTKILICFMLCVLSIAFVGCDKRTKKEKSFTYPTSADKVTSNGGLAVAKGNYVYFVNGTKSVNDATDKKAKYNVGSLMLMKLDANGDVVRNSDGLVNDDYYITMSNKLCGYEVTNLFISGNYLYFVTPCLENENDNKTWAKERVVFNRIKLDKTGEVEEVYSSDVKYSEIEYDYYEVNGETFILVYEKGDSYYSDGGNNTLVRVNATAKSNKEISRDVASVVFANDYDKIFYVKKESDTQFDVKKYNISTDAIVDYSSSNREIVVKFVAKDYVFATQSREHLTQYKDLVYSNITEQSTFGLFHSNITDNELYTSEDGTAVVEISGKEIRVISTNQFIGDNGATITKIITDENADTINVIGFTNGSLVYYTKADDGYVVKMVSYFNAISGGDTSIKEVATLSNVDEANLKASNFDISVDSDFMFFIEKSGSNNYLHRIRIVNTFEQNKEMFGVYENESDIPAEETTEE